MMNKIGFAFAATMALVSFSGCKKSGGAGEALAKMGEFKGRMCVCKDAECAKKVSDDMNKWSQDEAAKSKEPQSDADQKKAAEISTQMGECMQKATGPGAMGTPGPAGPAGATGATGATGDMGSAGSAGATGATGATGDMGSAGSAGAMGATGATGATGDMGSAGSAGATGATGATGARPATTTTTTNTKK